MIRLFIKGETNFNHNKYVLSECTNAIVTETVDGILDLYLEYPLIDKKGMSQYLVRGNIIKCPISATDARGEQLFRIRSVKPNTATKRISVYAQCIARADLMTDFILGVRVPTGQTRKQATALLLSNCVEHKDYYVGNLDTNTNTSINLGLDDDTGAIINYLDVAYVSPLTGLLGEKQSVQSAYGGEIIYNNKEINFVDERGSNHSFVISSGKNLQELEQETSDLDTDNFATAVIPCSSDGVYLPNNEIIYSPNATTLGKHFKKIVYDDVTLVNDSTEALDVVYAQLRERVQKDFDNGLDKLKINNTVNFIQLANTEEYKDYAQLEKCEIGNNVTVKYTKANITATGRVVKIKFNPLLNNGKGRIQEVEIGDRKTNIANTISSISSTASTANTKSDANTAEIKKVKKSTEDLEVLMEIRDNEIELSVTNLANNTTAQFIIQDGKINEKVSNTEFSSYRTQTAELISEKVSRGSDFSTEVTQSATSIVQALRGITNNKTTFNADGFTITGGGFTFEDIDGNDLIKALTSGGMRLGDSSWSKSYAMNMINLGGLPLDQYFMTSNIYGDSTLDMSDNDIDNISNFYAEYGEVTQDMYVDDTLYCESLEVVGGSKNCTQQTENFGLRKINAYETTEYYFGDIGSGIIQNGECLIAIDVVFQECINTDIEYHVFTQAYNGSITSIDRYPNYFIVYGTENTEFIWELKAKRKGFENNRLELSNYSK